MYRSCHIFSSIASIPWNWQTFWGDLTFGNKKILRVGWLNDNSCPGLHQKFSMWLSFVDIEGWPDLGLSLWNFFPDLKCCTNSSNTALICTSNVHGSNKTKWLTLKKVRSQPYPAKTITEWDYADDLLLLTNTSAQAESILHSLEQDMGIINLYMNANKAENICF